MNKQPVQETLSNCSTNTEYRTLPFHIRRTLPKEKRHLTDIIPPLPTTFAQGQNLENWRKRPILDQSANNGEPHHDYPWRYYEIALMKSLIGLNKKVKYIAQSIGLTKRHQVVSIILNLFALSPN